MTLIEIVALIIFLFPLAFSPGPGNMFFAALPNFLGILSFNLYRDRRNKQLKKLDTYSKKYGPASYLLIVILIIFANVNVNPEQASSLFAWMSFK